MDFTANTITDFGPKPTSYKIESRGEVEACNFVVRNLILTLVRKLILEAEWRPDLCRPRLSTNLKNKFDSKRRGRLWTLQYQGLVQTSVEYKVEYQP